MNVNTRFVDIETLVKGGGLKFEEWKLAVSDVLLLFFL